MQIKLKVQTYLVEGQNFLCHFGRIIPSTPIHHLSDFCS